MTNASGCRQTFDQAAEIYDRVRPDYPETLFDDLVALAGLGPGDRLLEVGCATGKATRPLFSEIRRRLPGGRTGRYDGTGERCCTWRGVARTSDCPCPPRTR
jgi:ubiquinone/menaquinone biosynthesis C-methylase UbiE